MRSRDFRDLYARLPEDVQRQAAAAFRQFSEDPFHSSLRFKRLAGFSDRWSVRIGLRYRAVGRRDGDSVIWFWIGTHADYDLLTRR